jgi:hypothetical protein
MSRCGHRERGMGVAREEAIDARMDGWMDGWMDGQTEIRETE